MSERSPTPWERPVALPTLHLAAVAALASAGAGAAWAAGALALGRGLDAAVTGLLAGAVVAVAAVTALLLIQPWRPRPISRWPVVWMAGSAGRLVVTLALTSLLYSAPTPYGTAGLWLAVVAAYLAVLVGETRAFAVSMKRFATRSPRTRE